MPDINALLARVVLLEKAALAALATPKTADAVPYFFHTQETFPYFTNRVSGIVVEGDSEDFDVDTYQVTMRLVVGHVTEGYIGEPESNLYTYIPQIQTYFNERDGLVDGTTYTSHMDELHWARVTACSGLRVFQNAGISAQQVGAEFTLTCRFEEQIIPAYS